MPYHWITNPFTPDAPAEMVDDARAAVKEELIADWAERFPDGQGDMELDPRFQAELLERTLRRVGEWDVLSDRAVVHQAQIIIANPLLVQAHPSEMIQTPGDLIQMALEDLPRRTSEWYDLRTLANRVVPFMKKHGIAGAESLIEPGQKAKARDAASLVKALIAEGGGNYGESPEVVEKVREIMADVADPHLTQRQFADKYAPSITIPALTYLKPGGASVILIECQNPAQEQRIRRALGKTTDWHSGDGTEPVLLSILAQKTGDHSYAGVKPHELSVGGDGG